MQKLFFVFQYPGPTYSVGKTESEYYGKKNNKNLWELKLHHKYGHEEDGLMLFMPR